MQKHKKIAVHQEVTLANHHESPRNSLPYASITARDLSKYSFDAIAAASHFAMHCSIRAQC